MIIRLSSCKFLDTKTDVSHLWALWAPWHLWSQITLAHCQSTLIDVWNAFLYGYNRCLLAWPLVPYHLQNLNEATVHSSYWHWCMMGHGWHLAVSRTASLEKESGHVWKGGTNFSNPPRLILALPWHSPGPLLRLVPPWMGWSWWMTVGLCSAGQAKT